jgi:hypothetical protein
MNGFGPVFMRWGIGAACLVAIAIGAMNAQSLADDRKAREIRRVAMERRIKALEELEAKDAASLLVRKKYELRQADLNAIVAQQLLRDKSSAKLLETLRRFTHE